MGFVFTKKYKILFLLALTLNLSAIVYLPSIYYLPFQNFFGLTNTQQGTLLSVYGTISIFAYFFGGLFADRIGVKPLLVWSSIVTGALALFTSTAPSYEIMLGIYVCYAVSFIFLQWPAFMKAVRMLGDSEEFARINGFWGLASNLSSLVVSYGLLFVFADAINGNGNFGMVIAFYACFSIAIGVGIQIFYKPDEFLTETAKAELEEAAKNKKGGGLDFSLIGQVLKMPAVWFAAIITLCGYMVTTTSSYFSPMLNSVYALPVSTTVAMGIAIKYVFRSFSGPMAAYFIEKFGYAYKLAVRSVPIIILVLIGMLVLPVDPAFANVALCLVSLFSFVIAFGAAGGMQPLAETKVNMALYGTAAGIVSAIGYSSDMWLFRVLGSIMDAQGPAAFKTIMCILIGIEVVLFIASTAYGKYLRGLIKQDPDKYENKMLKERLAKKSATK